MTEDEYRVEVTGHITVQADSKSKAEEKAEELAYGSHREVEHTGFVAHPLPSNETEFEDYYFTHINEMGNSASSTGYGLIRDKSALNVAFRSTTAMCRDLVGREGASPLRYNLAVFLLSTVEGYEWEDVQEFADQVKSKARELPDDVDNKYAAIAGTEFVVKYQEDEIEERFELAGPEEGDAE